MTGSPREVKVTIQWPAESHTSTADVEAVIRALSAATSEELVQIAPPRSPLGFGLTPESALAFTIALSNTTAVALFLRGLFSYLTERVRTLKGPVVLRVDGRTLTLPQGLSKEVMDKTIESFFKSIDSGDS